MKKCFIIYSFALTFFLFTDVISSEKDVSLSDILSELKENKNDLKQILSFLISGVHYHNYNSSQSNNDGNKLTATQNADIKNENKVNTSLSFSWIDYKKLSEYIEKYAEKIKKNSPDYCNFLCDNKYKIMAGFVGINYVYLQYQLYKIDTLLQNNMSWCNWKSTVPMQQLVCSNHDELIPSLLCDIQKKYLLSSKIVSKIHKFSQFDSFIKDLLYEQNILLRYLTIQKYTKFFCVSKLFCLSYKKSYIQEKINRLNLLLDVFIDWQTKELVK